MGSGRGGARADREEGCREETGGGQEEGCPAEEMSPASSPVRMAVPSSAQACSAASAVFHDNVTEHLPPWAAPAIEAAELAKLAAIWREATHRA